MRCRETALHRTHGGSGVDGGYVPDLRVSSCPADGYAWCLWNAITTNDTAPSLIDTTIDTT